METGEEGDGISCGKVEISYFSGGGGGSITATASFAATMRYLFIINYLAVWWQCCSKNIEKNFGVME